MKEATHPTNAITERQNELNLEDVYESVLTDAGRELGLDVDIRYGGTLTTYTVPETQDKIRYFASDMGFNTAQASYIAKDKVLCSELLQEKGVPCIEHVIFKEEDFSSLRTNNNFPLVLKPSKGGGGKDIHFVNNEAEFLTAYKAINSKFIAISPYVDFDIEYRVTVLDGKVLMTYGKTKGENNQNNLSKGAEVIATPPHLLTQLEDLALRAVQAIGLRSSNVDIVFHNGVTPLILEVNNTVALKRVAFAGEEFYKASVDAYVEMLKTALYDVGKNKR